MMRTWSASWKLVLCLRPATRLIVNCLSWCRREVAIHMQRILKSTWNYCRVIDRRLLVPRIWSKDCSFHCRLSGKSTMILFMSFSALFIDAIFRIQWIVSVLLWDNKTWCQKVEICGRHSDFLILSVKAIQIQLPCSIQRFSIQWF